MLSYVLGQRKLNSREKNVERLNIILLTIRNVNRLLVKEKNLDKLLRGICRNLTKNRGYYNSWIAIFDKSGSLSITTQSGLGDEFLKLEKLFKKGKLTACAKSALTHSGVLETHDPASECTDCPLASNYSDRIAKTVRLEFHKRVYGILTVSTPKHFSDNKYEQELLEEIAADIAYALHNVEIEAIKKETKESLRESEERYRSVFENTGTATFIVEEDTTISMVNSRFENLSGYPREEIEGKKKWTEFVAAEDLKRMKTYHVKRRKDEESAPTEYEFRFIDKHGNKKDIFCKIGMLPGTKRSIASWMDITARKHAEIALHESEQSFRELVENSLIGIGIIQDNQVIFRNPEQQRLLGPSSSLTNPFNFENIHDEDVNKVKELYQNLISDRAQTLQTDFRFYPPGKRNFKPDMKWVYCRASMINYEGKAAILVNLMDITRAKELENLLLIQDKMTSLGHMAAGIAHEIRNPLSGINIYLNTLERINKKRGGTKKELDIIQDIQSASYKIESVIRRVMDFSKPSELRLILKSINEPIEEALKLSDVTLRKSGIKIIKDLEKDLPLCYIDPPLIEEVVLNLITNAANALRSSSREKLIRVITTSDKRNIIIKVADSGPGIPMSIRDKIFDPFFTTRNDSSGIGLSITNRIVTDHGGSIDVKTSEFKGAEFHVNIPIQTKADKK